MSHESFDPSVWTVTGEEPIYLDTQTQTLRSLQDFDSAANIKPHEPTNKIPVIRPQPHMVASVFADHEPEPEIMQQERLFDPCGDTAPKEEDARNLISSIAYHSARGLLWLFVWAVAMLFIVVLGISLLYGTIARGLLWIVNAALEGIK